MQHSQRLNTRRSAVSAGSTVTAVSSAATAPPWSKLRDHSSRNSVLMWALLVFVAAMMVYGFFTTFTYSGDDLQYASLIQNQVTGDVIYHPTGYLPYLSHVETSITSLPINPRYLLEWPTSILAAKIWYALGLSGTVITPIEVLRMIAGALGLSIFFLGIYRVVRNIPISLVTTLGLGLTVSYWTYSIHLDQTMNVVTILCLAFYIFVRQTQTGFTRPGLLLLITVLALASFYNLTAAVTTVAFGIGVALFSQPKTVFGRVLVVARFGLAYAVVVSVCIAAAIAVFDSPANIVHPAFWREAAFAGRPDYMVSPIHDAVRAAFGLGRSQVLFPGVYGSLNNYFESAPADTRVLLSGYYGIILLLLASPLIFLAVRRKQLGEKGKIAAFLFVWLFAHSVFNWYWDPGYSKYWLIPLVCCWAIFALALDHVRTTLSSYYRPAFAAVCAIIALSFVVNLTSQFLPDTRARDNKWLSNATQLKIRSQAVDLFLSPGHPLDFYVSFFGRRDILSAELISLANGNDDAALQTIFTSRIADHRADDGKIYVYGLETLQEADRAEFLNLLGKGTLTEAWALPGTTIYQWNSTACHGSTRDCP